MGRQKIVCLIDRYISCFLKTSRQETIGRTCSLPGGRFGVQTEVALHQVGRMAEGKVMLFQVHIYRQIKCSTITGTYMIKHEFYWVMIGRLVGRSVHIDRQIKRSLPGTYMIKHQSIIIYKSINFHIYLISDGEISWPDLWVRYASLRYEKFTTKIVQHIKKQG